MNAECIKCGKKVPPSDYIVFENKKDGPLRLGEEGSIVNVCKNCMKIIINRKAGRLKYNNIEEVQKLEEIQENSELTQLVTEAEDISNNSLLDFKIEVHLPNSDDIENYINKCLKSRFEKLQFKWENQCMDCGEEDQFDTFQALIGHIEDYHFNIVNGCECIFVGCKAKYPNIKLMARHIVLEHCEFFKSLQIYGSCIHCNFNFSNFISFNQHSCYRAVKRSAGLNLHCKICNFFFISFKRFQFHMQFHESSQRPMGCFICKDVFTNIDKCFEHLMYAHEEEAKLTCQICDRVFFHQGNFDVHMTIHDPSHQYNCDLCTAKFSHQSQIKRHKEVIHGEKPKKEVYICDKCDKTFLTYIVRKQHMTTHAIENKVEAAVCTKCGQVGNTTEELEPHIEAENSICFQAHIDVESLLNAYTCEYCSLDFKSDCDLVSHRNTVHQNKIFTCFFCKKEFKDFKALTAHGNIHLSVKKKLGTLPLNRMFLCNVDDCLEAYRHWAMLQQHKRRSHRQKTCIGCKQIFNEQEALTLHQENCKELPEEIGQCQFCKKSFGSKNSLLVHIGMRHNIKNVNCDTCEASFKNKEALQKHIDTFHRVVQCEFCLRDYKNRRCYEAHIKKFHPST